MCGNIDACRNENCVDEVNGYTCDCDEDYELMLLLNGSVCVANEREIFSRTRFSGNDVNVRRCRGSSEKMSSRSARVQIEEVRCERGAVVESHETRAQSREVLGNSRPCTARHPHREGVDHHQPCRMLFLPLAEVERLVSCGVALKAGSWSAPRWRAPTGRGIKVCSFLLGELALYAM